MAKESLIGMLMAKAINSTSIKFDNIYMINFHIEHFLIEQYVMFHATFVHVHDLVRVTCTNKM